MMTIKQIDQL